MLFQERESEALPAAAGRLLYHSTEIPHYRGSGCSRVTLSVFQLYGFHTSNIIEVRYKAFMHMCSSTRKELLAKMTKIKLASEQSK